MLVDISEQMFDNQFARGEKEGIMEELKNKIQSIYQTLLAEDHDFQEFIKSLEGKTTNEIIEEYYINIF